MVFYGIAPTWAVVCCCPLFLLLAIATALGFGLWLAALNVRYRDVNYLVPFLVQIWMYVTPVVYGSTLIPERFRWLLALNPMAGVVEGFRWALLGERLADARRPACCSSRVGHRRWSCWSAGLSSSAARSAPLRTSCKLIMSDIAIRVENLGKLLPHRRAPAAPRHAARRAGRRALRCARLLAQAAVAERSPTTTSGR